MSEHDEQVALFNWAMRQECIYPELELFHAIPNGGHRHKATAAKLKAEGVKAGVPDTFLPVARRGFHGLYIEMKFGGNKPTDSQRYWIDNLTDEGYCAVVCNGFMDAKDCLLWYLGEKQL